jgi:hypothetical protein
MPLRPSPKARRTACLLSQGEPEVYDEGYAGQGDEQAEASEDRRILGGPRDQELDVLPLPFPDVQARSALQKLQSCPHTRCKVVGAVKLGQAVARGGHSDDVDALIADQGT